MEGRTVPAHDARPGVPTAPAGSDARAGLATPPAAAARPADRTGPAQKAPPVPDLEAAFGMRAYLSSTPGIGGRLRTEPEDFQVIEMGAGPPRVEDGTYAAARIRLRNWETNRFAGKAAKELHIKRGQVAFAGMKDKRAVTEQWFTFRCPADRITALERLQDVDVLETYPTRKAHHAGAHAGNRFILRVRDHHAQPEAVEETLTQIRATGGVPNFFGPQRFGAAFRPVTHLVGAAIVAGDLEEAVRLYLGNPVETEQKEAFEARKVYEETRDPEAALAVYPHRLDPERAMLSRLRKRPDDWRYALQALPHNLLQLFVHSHQSWIFNHVISARVEAGLGLNTAHVGDEVIGTEEDGTRTHTVSARNKERVQRELDRGRAVLTAPLVGYTYRPIGGAPGEVEAKVLEELGIDPTDFTCPELPQVASDGRRRGILQPVQELDVTWVDRDPVFSFDLGRGAYATVVMREFMKGAVADF